MCLFYDMCKLDTVYKQQLYEMCTHEMQHALALKDLSCIRAYDGHRGDNATLQDHYSPLLDSGFSRYEVGNEYVRASANSKHGAIYSDNGMFTSILEEPDKDYSLYMRLQIERFESEIRKNGWWKVVLEMVPEHDQCVVYLQELRDSVRPRRGVDTIPVALATLVYYIMRVTLKRTKSRIGNDSSFALLLRDRRMKLDAAEKINEIIKELTELSMMVETTISEVSHELPPSSEITISAYENTHDSVWSRMQDAPTQCKWSDFKDSLGIKKVQTVAYDMTSSVSKQAITQSLKTVHEFQYIYDLSKSGKTEFLRDYGLLYGPTLASEAPVTCQKMFSIDAATPSLFSALRYTHHQPLCAVVEGEITINNHCLGAIAI